jgi:hypothetical protein
VIFQVLTAASTKIAVFKDVAPCSDVSEVHVASIISVWGSKQL